MSYPHIKFHDNGISSFRGVAMTKFLDGRTDGQTDGQTDGVTALLDLLSPLTTQVKIQKPYCTSTRIPYHIIEYHMSTI